MLVCPLCETEAEEFKPWGNPPRKNARCPGCGSAERHRAVWLYLTEQTDLFVGPRKRFLHVAPERVIQSKLRTAANIDYLSGDLQSPKADIKLDITDIDMPDASFDVIYCSHVLEHIPDDHKAMSELYRVLKPGGWAILLVPSNRKGLTIEDFGLSPAERLRRYGQADHVRIYGRDYRDRLERAGWGVMADPYPRRCLGEARARRHGIRMAQIIHYCWKDAAPA